MVRAFILSCFGLAILRHQVAKLGEWRVLLRQLSWSLKHWKPRKRQRVPPTSKGPTLFHKPFLCFVVKVSSKISRIFSVCFNAKMHIACIIVQTCSTCLREMRIVAKGKLYGINSYLPPWNFLMLASYESYMESLRSLDCTSQSHTKWECLRFCNRSARFLNLKFSRAVQKLCVIIFVAILWFMAIVSIRFYCSKEPFRFVNPFKAGTNTCKFCIGFFRWNESAVLPNVLWRRSACFSGFNFLCIEFLFLVPVIRAMWYGLGIRYIKIIFLSNHSGLALHKIAVFWQRKFCRSCVQFSREF